jgi:LAO/AO transport system kinase
MGDKTRMEQLSQLHEAFIRPSPSAGSLGGVARKTRETSILCEAAGFDVILIETVGVGQSETAVKRMVDYFLLLLLPGAGDELQGIKRGIMEMADAIAINKADGDNKKRAEIAAADVRRAIHLFPPDPRGWQVRVNTCSSLHNKGIDTLWEDMEQFQRHMVTKGHFERNRQNQAEWWLNETISDALLTAFSSKEAVVKRQAELIAELRENKISPFTAARELVALFLNN